ncbi:MAG: TatD family hydrolase [Muribaculaceae bacterium]|nr:TatD family hydrolase [Muribaculaceae bacterium]
MIDTHTHLYMTDSFPDGGKAAVRHAMECGVDMMVLPGVDRESVAPIIELHRAFPSNTAVALGLHPTEVEADWRDELREIFEAEAELSLVGIGETGVDLHWEQKYLTRQMDAFGEQIQMALDRKLPVVVHSRDAFPETIEVVRSFGSNLPGMVFHSFTAGRPEAERLLEFAPDAFFGINGVVTFKNAAPLREAVEHLPLALIVTETDAPFLAPVPYRGQTNESAFIPHIVKAIAAAKGLSEEEVMAATTANALRLFPRLTP